VRLPAPFPRAEVLSAFVLIPGAGGARWYWHLLIPGLERLGHEAIAVDIREDDPALGLPEYADRVRAAIGERDDVVLVAQSLGGFTASMVAADTPVSMIVLVNAMIPLPGETPGEWWGTTGSEDARRANDEAAGRSTEFDEQTHFLHDIDPAVAASGASEQRAPSPTPFGQPCAFERWPDVPIHVVVGRGDRFFPADFQRAVARDRLSIEADEIAGGHLVALSNPSGLAAQLQSYVV
jgi:pimeloyl-ACP methyl ester carboxylesterase